MTVFLILTAMLSISLTFMSHPVTLLAIIIFQTLMICLSSWIIIKTSWLSFILFLIFLGGLMVLFVYVVSMSPNEKFETSYHSIYTYFLFTSLILMTSMLMMFFLQNKMLMNMSMTFNNMLIFNTSNVLPTLMIMFYLLYTLIVAVKIASKFEGPLRNLIK